MKTAWFYCRWLQNDGALNFVQFFWTTLYVCLRLLSYGHIRSKNKQGTFIRAHVYVFWQCGRCTESYNRTRTWSFEDLLVTWPKPSKIGLLTKHWKLVVLVPMIHCAFVFTTECIYTKSGVRRSTEGDETLEGSSTWRKGLWFSLICTMWQTGWKVLQGSMHEHLWLRRNFGEMCDLLLPAYLFECCHLCTYCNCYYYYYYYMHLVTLPKSLEKNESW